MLQFLQIGVTVFGVVFLVELPDKTALATVVMASRMSAISVFVGVAVAFAVQSLVAVVAGSLLGFFSPRLIHAVAGLVFLVVAGVLFWQTRRQSEPAETPPTTESKWHHSPVVTAFVVVFASEWGDLSQLATAALQAQYQQPILVFVAATVACWSVAAIAIVVGNRLGTLLPRRPLQLATVAISTLIGLILIAGALRG
ncbi:MAG TPA: TMEM165/GDT1 family protein [Candidatus Dormibacteraeota bacterium]